jgi:hypothetical protein
MKYWMFGVYGVAGIQIKKRLGALKSPDFRTHRVKKRPDWRLA